MKVACAGVMPEPASAASKMYSCVIDMVYFIISAAQYRREYNIIF